MDADAVAATLAPIQRLPTEVFERILFRLKLRRGTFNDCALVCRSWLPYTYRYRFGRMQLNDPDPKKGIDLKTILEFFESNPRAAAHVSSLQLNREGVPAPGPAVRTLDLTLLAKLVNILPSLRSMELHYDQVANYPAVEQFVCTPRALDRLWLSEFSIPTQDCLHILLVRIFGGSRNLHLSAPIAYNNSPESPLWETNTSPRVLRLATPRFLRLDVSYDGVWRMGSLRGIFDLSNLEEIHLRAADLKELDIVGLNEFLSGSTDKLTRVTCESFHGDVGNGVKVVIPGNSTRLSFLSSARLALHCQPSRLLSDHASLTWLSMIHTLQALPSSLHSLNVHYLMYSTGEVDSLKNIKSDAFIEGLSHLNWVIFGEMIDARDTLMHLRLCFQLTSFNLEVAPDKSLVEECHSFLEKMRDYVLSTLSSSRRPRARKILEIATIVSEGNGSKLVYLKEAANARDASSFQVSCFAKT